MSVTGSERATRTRAGPSKPAPKPKRRQAKEVEEEEESDDFTAQVRASAEEDEIMEVPAPRTRKVAARPVNGKPAAKGKGKAKADSAPAKKVSSRADVEVIDDDDDIGPTGAAQAINDATVNNRAAKPSGTAGGTAATRQIERLKRELETANAHIQDLAKQLEESYRVRHTEPEELLARQVEKYEEIIQTKDLLLKQQQEMLEHKEPLSRDGKTSVLHMITREQADADKRSAEGQVTYWQAQVDEKDMLLAEKDQHIAELKQIQSDLQYEIKTERQNSQKASRNPPSAQRGRGPNGLLGSNDPKHAELVSFYEDVTNLLVTDIKIQEPKYFDLDEWSLTCVYTYTNKAGASDKSLSFVLRFTHDPLDASLPVESAADLDRAAQYTPLNLDQESPEFIGALEFLNTGFAFPRTQLPLFFNSLVENMKAACEDEQSETGSNHSRSMEDVQLVE
ncbi:hypothetical protein B0H15DRAFT_846569 [Mycena belliarum]|uniref:Monopolin complex subunit Csm1/Pcs1 C-terminal domain-containing protein n=1 Tax=Mycena belliarum TaxID=1033014 RepID=A0AAD6U0P0_9AGAR|nr:hypothetical protein B0H15DRAFT_846569 [Mycena belliae]